MTGTYVFFEYDGCCERKPLHPPHVFARVLRAHSLLKAAEDEVAAALADLMVITISFSFLYLYFFDLGKLQDRSFS